MSGKLKQQLEICRTQRSEHQTRIDELEAKIAELETKLAAIDPGNAYIENGVLKEEIELLEKQNNAMRQDPNNAALAEHILSAHMLMRRNAELEAELRQIAAYAHHGGLLSMDPMTAIRKATLQHWDKDECDKLQALSGGE